SSRRIRPSKSAWATSIDSSSKALAGSREVGSPLGKFNFRICRDWFSESPDAPQPDKIRARASSSAVPKRHPFFTPIPPVEAENRSFSQIFDPWNRFPSVVPLTVRKKEPRLVVKKGYEGIFFFEE